MRPLPGIIMRTKKISASTTGKLSERAFKATMMQQSEGLPPRPRNAYQLFCADFKQGQQQQLPLDEDDEGEIAEEAEEEEEEEEGEREEDDDENSESGQGGAVDDDGDEATTASSSSSSSSSTTTTTTQKKRKSPAKVTAGAAWKKHKQSHRGAGTYAITAAEEQSRYSPLWEAWLLKYHAIENKAPWLLSEEEVVVLESKQQQKKKPTKKKEAKAAAATFASSSSVDLRCSCTSKCKTTACSCKKAGVPCGPNCHGKKRKCENPYGCDEG